MDPETEQLSEEAPQVGEGAPETLIVKRRGRPAGARNKTKAESSTGGTVETAEVPEREHTPDPFVYCTNEAPRHHGGDDETITAQGEKGTSPEKGCNGPAATTS